MLHQFINMMALIQLKFRLFLWNSLILFSTVGFGQTVMQHQIDSLKQLLQSNENPELKPKLMNSISFIYKDIDPKQGLNYAEKAFNAAMLTNDSSELAFAYNNMANNYCMMANLDQSVSHYYLAIQQFEAIGHQKGKAGALGSIAKVESMKGNYSKALEYDSLGLDIAHKMNDQIGIALMSSNIANIYSTTGDTTRAITAFNKAITIYDKLGMELDLGKNLLNLGIIYQEQADLKNAYNHFTKAYTCFKEINYPEGVVSAATNLGICYYLQAAQRESNNTLKSNIQVSKKEALFHSEKYLLEASSIIQSDENRQALKSIYETLSKNYLLSQNFENALKYVKLYHENKDSINNIEGRTKIEKLTSEREAALQIKQIEIDKLAVEKKRNERAYFAFGIGLLIISLVFIYRNYANQKKSNKALEKLNDQIAGTNNELETKNQKLVRTLKELEETQTQLIQSEKQKENANLRSKISIDIREEISMGLSNISELSELLRTTSAEQTQPADIAIVDKINNYSKEALNKLGEIIWSTNPERDNLLSLLAYMKAYVDRFLEDSNISCRVFFPDPVPDFPLNPELRRNLFLVYKEAIHNCFKYSKASMLEINFGLSEEQYLLRIKDDGVGFEQGMITGSGNGMINMKRRMQNIGGEFQLNSASGLGTELRFKGKIYS